MELALRGVTALIFGSLALLSSYLGGWAFKVFIISIGALVLFEAQMMAKDYFTQRTKLLSWVFYLFIACLLLSKLAPCYVFASIFLCAMILLLLSWPKWQWVVLAFLYAAVPVACLCFLRTQFPFGFYNILFLYTVVWATDIGAYFCGRLIGGAKLAPRFSPKKTWSGAIGGAFFAVLCAGLLFFYVFEVANFYWGVLAVALILSLVAQCGDIAESSVKRFFGVKDSSHLLPGHGGFMDRVDGLVVAAGVFYFIQFFYPLIQYLKPFFSLRW